MKKLLSLLSIFAIVLSCSSDETSTPVTPPPAPIAKYTITLSAGEGGTVSTTGGEYEAGQTVSVTATPQGEYLFKDWSDGNTDATRTITVNSNSTLTANFEKRKYPLTLNIEGEGEVLEEIVNAGRTTDYDSGTTVKLTAVPAEGWEFAGWTGAMESEELEVQLLVSEAKTLSATFEISVQQLFSNKNFYIDQLLVTQPSILQFGTNIDYQETEEYVVSKKGWLGFTPEEYHNGGNYGNIKINPGYCYLEYRVIMYSDLNNDGLEDVILMFEYGPHTVERTQSGIPFFALINKGDGTFDFTQDYFSLDFVRSPMAGYKSTVADFNGDGKNDFILGTRGAPIIGNNGETNSLPGPPLLALSNDNSYYDNSENLYGIHAGTVNSEDDRNSDGIADFMSDRALASGDFDNDGDIDFFMTEKILLNDGNGNFLISPEQISNDFIPVKLDGNANTYEAHSNDFNNDGFFDIVIAPDSGYISRNGGSGWIIMSNGTPNFSEWVKLPLPNPRYINNSKLNDFESTDIDNDGYVDLIVATTRDTPYYVGAGIQILRNNSGNGFVDITNSNIEDQSMFDQWSGEGSLILKDFNNDGVLDIFHNLQSNYDMWEGGNEHHGINIYINNNGFFEIYDTKDKIPFVSQFQFIGWENDMYNPNIRDVQTLNYSFPINVNNEGLIDFISHEKEKSYNYTDDNYRPSSDVFFTILSKQN